MADDPLTSTFARLRTLLEPYLDRASVKTDTPQTLYLEVPGGAKPEMFAAVMLKKSYVSFHYQPVYVEPALVADLPGELQRRMQGKSCFNFKRPDDPAVEALQALIAGSAAGFLASRETPPPG